MVDDKLGYPAEQAKKMSTDLELACSKEAFADVEFTCADESSDKAAKLAHDINNMLLVIQNTLELSWGNSEIPEDKIALKTIKMAVEKAANLAGQIMGSSPNPSGAATTTVQPRDFLSSCQTLLSGVAAHNVKVHVSAEGDLPPIEVHADQLCDMLMNLVKNASEAYGGKPGPVHVSVRPDTMNSERDTLFSHGACKPKHGKGVVFTVEDHGPGADQASIKKMLRHAFSTKDSGHGIGLVSVMNFVKNSHGGVSIESEIGSGFIIRIWIPELDAYSNREHKTLSRKNSNATIGDLTKRKKTKSPCILVLDDDPAILQSSALLLSSMNAEVLMVNNPDEAFKIFSENKDRIDIVFLDANLGSSTTLPVLENLRSLDPLVPCVIVSGYAESKIRSLFSSHLYNGFLGKPYTRSDVTKILYQFAKVR